MDRDASRAAAPSLATTRPLGGSIRSSRRWGPTACRHSGKAHQGMISQLDF